MPRIASRAAPISRSSCAAICTPITLAADYDTQAPLTGKFFASVQNKLHWAIRENAQALCATKAREAAEKAHQRRLGKLGLDADAAWAKLEKLVGASDYDEAMTLAVDLRDLAARDDDANIFAVRFETMRKRLLRRRGFFDRWKRGQHEVARVRP